MWVPPEVPTTAIAHYNGAVGMGTAYPMAGGVMRVETRAFPAGGTHPQGSELLPAAWCQLAPSAPAGEPLSPRTLYAIAQAVAGDGESYDGSPSAAVVAEPPTATAEPPTAAPGEGATPSHGLGAKVSAAPLATEAAVASTASASALEALQEEVRRRAVEAVVEAVRRGLPGLPWSEVGEIVCDKFWYQLPENGFAWVILHAQYFLTRRQDSVWV